MKRLGEKIKIASFGLLFSCTTMNSSICSFSEQRLQSIQHQRKILDALKGEDRLGSLKAATIDKKLSEEESTQKDRIQKWCKK